MTGPNAQAVESVRDASAPLPLSVGQEALWFLYALDRGNNAYNVATPLRIRSAVDVPALELALRAMVDRHALLRSVFTEVDGRPVRFERGADLVRLEVRDAPEVDEAGLRRLIDEAVAAPFELDTAGPLRALLVRRSAVDAVLVLTSHHIAVDALSQWIMLRDLLDAYQAAVGGDRPQWAADRPSYHAWVLAEQERLGSARHAASQAYWREVCAGAVPAELPLDRPRPADQTHHGASYFLRLPDDLLPRLRTAAAGLGVTPFGVLLGSWQAVLHRYTGQSDLVLGCPTTTRLSRSTRDVVGYLVNTLLLRARFAPDTTFADAAVAAHGQVAQAMAHVGHPFALLGPLSGERGANAAPLFRITVSMLSTHQMDPLQQLLLERVEEGAQCEYAGLRLASFDVSQPGSQFDLQIEVRQSRSALTVVFRYNTDLFDAATVERLAGHYRRLLETAVDAPDTRVDQAPLVQAAELEMLLAFGTATA